jgi:hypothetical protein
MNYAAFDQLGGGPTGAMNSRFPGMLGQTNQLTNRDALKVSYTTTGTLYNGTYQLVKFASGVTTVTRGQILFWDTLANNGLANYTVIASAGATNKFRAGIALTTETAAGGLYCWIQTGGLASCLYKSSPSDTTIGDVVIQTSLSTTTVDAIADATDFGTTMGALSLLVGVAYEQPVTAAVKRVLLNPHGFYPNEA